MSPNNYTLKYLLKINENRSHKTLYEPLVIIILY